jgi:hypothetical protein
LGQGRESLHWIQFFFKKFQFYKRGETVSKISKFFENNK